MAIRVRYGVQVQLSDEPTNETHNLGDLDSEVVDDELNDGGIRKQTLVAGAVDEDIDLCGIASAQFIVIRTRAKDPLETPVVVNIILNGGTDEIAILPVGVAKEGHFLLTASSITAITASNPGAVDMEVLIAAAGD